MVAIRAAESAAQQLALQYPGQHPVAQLMEKAKSDFDNMLSRQSKTYEEAVEEYRRRYKVDLPPGFRGWYDFAVKNQSPIIDDFDTIYQSVSPFWKLSGQEVLDVMNNAYKTPHSELWQCTFHGDTAKTECRHPYRSFDRHLTLLFDEVLGDLAGVLPDVKFIVNHLDEPRVVVPPEDPAGTRFALANMSHKSVWKELTAPCSSSSKRNDTTDNIDTCGLSFVTSAASSLDICANPSYASSYGLFISPVSLRLLTGLVPVLSTGAPSTMSDILYPSAAYIESGFVYDPTRDIPWEQKSNNLYWAGSTTGGYASSSSSSSSEQWKSFHRQRFVALAQNLNHQPHTYLRSLNGVITRFASPFLNSRLFSVFFTRFQFCSPSTCRAQRSFFRTKSYADKDEAFGSRLVFDLDGNGISGRYYKLLASNSAVLKQTLLREWHDDRLVPWVHYFP
ncbi:hypothetical protein N0V85_006961, partial [Neurospora sp. IMI 360204]